MSSLMELWAMLRLLLTMERWELSYSLSAGNGKKCKEYESVISITSKWPMNGVHRENEFGTACQMPDGRWVLE